MSIYHSPFYNSLQQKEIARSGRQCEKPNYIHNRYRTTFERVPKGQVTPYVVWVAYAGGLRISYAITGLACAEDMTLDAYGGLTRTYADLSFAYADIHMTRLLHSMMTGVLERAHLH